MTQRQNPPASNKDKEKYTQIKVSVNFTLHKNKTLFDINGISFIFNMLKNPAKKHLYKPVRFFYTPARKTIT